MVETYPSMAGSGDPWSYWTKLRRKILRKMHDGLTTIELAQAFNQSTEQILSELRPLQTASLIKPDNGGFTPAFFIADCQETEKVHQHSQSTGRKLSEALLSHWDHLESSYGELSLSQQHSFDELSFMLVGSRILDIGLLGALTRDRTLLTTAPSRPSPERPDARYYFWMVEGELEHLGKYGQNDTDLPWPDWHLLTFGKNWIESGRNTAREELERRCAELVESDSLGDPKSLSAELDVPYLSEADSEKWAAVSERLSDRLLDALIGCKSEINELYQSLKASKYTSDSFGEFFCWYYHLVFAWAIDFLFEKGMMTIPSDWFSSIILYRKGREGILVT